MPRRYLFGPVERAFADQNLYEARECGECLAFDLRDGSDLTIGIGKSWADVCSRFPRGWQPDFVVLYLPYRTIPTCLWSPPVPIVGLAGDWNYMWHYYRHCLPACDLVLTDTVGVETLARQGLRHGRVANIFGCERVYLESPPSAAERDIDVLFVGSFHPAMQRERLPWLGRVAALAERWKVVLTNGFFHDDYRALLGRARIVFNRSVHGECNQRAFEATALGALLFQEAGNREVGAYFKDRQEYVAYQADDLESLLTYYLEHEDERRAIAEAGRRRAREYSFAQLWKAALEGVIDGSGFGSHTRSSFTPDPSPLRGEGEKRRPPAGAEMLQLRSWQALQTRVGEADSTLAGDLQQALAANPRSAVLHNALAVTLALAGHRNAAPDSLAVTHALRQAVYHDSTHVMASLNLAEVLLHAGQTGFAVEQARQALTLLRGCDRLSPEVLNAAHLPPVFDHFWVEWERAAWCNAGQPTEEARAKHALLRWRLHSLLATATGELGHFTEAAAARPDLPPTQAALGCALTGAKRFTEALPYLKRALAGNPFDLPTAKTLFRALAEVADWPEQHRLVRKYQLLRRGSPTSEEARLEHLRHQPVRR